jgi:hypothetical protein
MEGSEIWISFRRIWVSFRRTLILFRVALISFRRILNSFHASRSLERTRGVDPAWGLRRCREMSFFCNTRGPLARSRRADPAPAERDCWAAEPHQSDCLPRRAVLQAQAQRGGGTMAWICRFSCARAAVAALVAAGVFVSAGPANAVVYCKTYGVPEAALRALRSRIRLWSIAKLSASRKAASCAKRVLARGSRSGSARQVSQVRAPEVGTAGVGVQ